MVDVLEQAVAIGDLHHAIDAGLLHSESVYAELADVIVGRKPGRSEDSELFVFDSTGTALQDVAAADVVYERAVAQGLGREVTF